MVVELTTSNFEEIVGKDKYVVVKFYTRWCGYCRLMSPEYEKLFDMYKEKRSDIVIARLEASINEEISMKYGIYSFPMVVIFHPNDLHVKDLFQGRRVASVISEWIDKNSPMIENKMLEVKKEMNFENLDQNMIIIKANKTEVTDEFEFIKREIITLKNRVEKLEKEIEGFKSLNNTLSTYEYPKTFNIILFLGIGFTLIALLYTVKRLFFRKNLLTNGEHNAHAKV